MLPKKQAAENFDYFMRVRLERLAYFQEWLRRHFNVTITPDAKGILALNRWGNKYAGFLLVETREGQLTNSYFTYDPPWTEEYAGNNALFDMGIALGEFIIVNCPKLYWAFDPTSAVLPKTARQQKKDFGTSFQRPELTGSDNPTWSGSPLHEVWFFSLQMSRLATTFEGANKLRSFPRDMRYNNMYKIKTYFDATILYYPKNDPYNLRGKLIPEDYVRLIESDEEEDVNNE